MAKTNQSVLRARSDSLNGNRPTTFDKLVLNSERKKGSLKRENNGNLSDAGPMFAAEHQQFSALVAESASSVGVAEPSAVVENRSLPGISPLAPGVPSTSAYICAPVS